MISLESISMIREAFQNATAAQWLIAIQLLSFVLLLAIYIDLRMCRYAEHGFVNPISEEARNRPMPQKMPKEVKPVY